MTSTRTPARETLLALTDAARLLRTYVDRRASEHGMTRAQWGTLTRIERQAGLMQAEIAEQMELQPISLVPILDRLCEQGLIERRPHPEDRRAKQLFLTAKGAARLKELSPLADEISGMVFDGLDAADVGLLKARLHRVKDNIKRALERRLAPARQP